MQFGVLRTERGSCPTRERVLSFDEDGKKRVLCVPFRSHKCYSLARRMFHTFSSVVTEEIMCVVLRFSEVQENSYDH